MTSSEVFVKGRGQSLDRIARLSAVGDSNCFPEGRGENKRVILRNRQRSLERRRSQRIRPLHFVKSVEDLAELNFHVLFGCPNKDSPLIAWQKRASLLDKFEKVDRLVAVRVCVWQTVLVLMEHVADESGCYELHEYYGQFGEARVDSTIAFPSPE